MTILFLVFFAILFLLTLFLQFILLNGGGAALKLIDEGHSPDGGVFRLMIGVAGIANILVLWLFMALLVFMPDKFYVLGSIAVVLFLYNFVSTAQHCMAIGYDLISISTLLSSVGGLIVSFGYLYSCNELTAVSLQYNFYYFSIVTFTTLGYGDFNPVGISKALAVIEAIIGMFSISILASISYGLRAKLFSPKTLLIVASFLIFIYALLYHHFGLAFRSAPQESIGDYLYFSCITFLTVGYGDIVPNIPTTRLLAASEALLGFFYVKAQVRWLSPLLLLVDLWCGQKKNHSFISSRVEEDNTALPATVPWS